jgi:hypothetical protein
MSHQTFWKPEKKVKEPKGFGISKGKKEKREVPEWKRGILSHHLSTPGKAERGEFPKNVVAEAIERSKGICQCCKQVPCTTTHHVWGRGRGGRGVLSNAYRACGQCHINIESNDELKQSIIEEYRQLYGDRFYFDEQDWIEFGRKEIASKTAEEERKQRMERINPIVDLLVAASGRKLKAAEVRLIDGMDDHEMLVFAKMMADVVAASIPAEKHVPAFGYGQFND